MSRSEKRFVTAGDVPAAEWDAIAARDFHIVYLMGVWQRSALGRDMARSDASMRAQYDRVLPGWSMDDVPGSPYSIQDYVPDRRMGGWSGLDRARRELNDRGIGLMLDYVPNHTGFDHPWVRNHPDRYVLGTADDLRSRPREFHGVMSIHGPVTVARGRDPYFEPWQDVAQLNYFNPAARAAMVGELRSIAAHCDGVRCDMAMLVLNDVFERTWRGVLRDSWPRPVAEFWSDATRQIPELLYLAEVYWDFEWTLQQQGFDYTYDKRLLDRLRDTAASAPPGAVASVRAHLSAEPAFGNRLARFLENHDEDRSAAVFRNRLPAAATLLCTAPGLRFFFDGQIEGRRIHAPVQLGRWPDEEPEVATESLYRRLLTAASADRFHDGEWKLLEVGGAGDATFINLIAYRWRLGDARALVVVNLGASASQGHVAVSADLPAAGDALVFVDELDGQRYRRELHALRESGLYVRLGSGQAHLFSVEPAL